MRADTHQKIQHPALGLVRYSVSMVREDPDGQVTDTIGLMRRYVLEDYKSPEIGNVLESAGRLYPGPVTSSVWRYVKERVRFVEDRDTAYPVTKNPDVVEVLIRPSDMIRLGPRARGDCDDFVMLGAAMLLRAGVRVNFVTVAASKRDTTRYSHVYLAAYPEGRRIPLDISHGAYPGWEVPDNRVYKRREWEIQPSLFPMLALVGVIYVANRYA